MFLTSWISDRVGKEKKGGETLRRAGLIYNARGGDYEDARELDKERIMPKEEPLNGKIAFPERKELCAKGTKNAEVAKITIFKAKTYFDSPDLQSRDIVIVLGARMLLGSFSHLAKH